MQKPLNHPGRPGGERSSPADCRVFGRFAVPVFLAESVNKALVKTSETTQCVESP